jgi:hypothetical protein
VTEAYHVPLDRRGTPPTCYLVADKFGFGNCQTFAPPALGGPREGSAVAPRGTVAAQSSQAFRRQSAKAAAAGAETATTIRRRQPCAILETDYPAVTGRPPGKVNEAVPVISAIATERRIATATKSPNDSTTPVAGSRGDEYGCSNDALWVQSIPN